jgi:hypothetical protein
MKTQAVLAALILIAGTAGCGCNRTPEDELAAEVAALGGDIERDEQRPGRPVIKVLLGNTPTTDGTLAYLRGQTELRDLYLLGTHVTDVGLRHLEGLLRLETLSLARTQVSDMGLRHLEGLSRLRCLDLEGTQVTNKGLARLHGLRELKTLYLARTRVTDAGVDQLQQALPGLKIVR